MVMIKRFFFIFITLLLSNSTVHALSLSDDFETGDISYWDDSRVQGANMSVSTDAARTGTYGLEIEWLEGAGSASFADTTVEKTNLSYLEFTATGYFKYSTGWKWSAEKKTMYFHGIQNDPTNSHMVLSIGRRAHNGNTSYYYNEAWTSGPNSGAGNIHVISQATETSDSNPTYDLWNTKEGKHFGPNVDANGDILPQNGDGSYGYLHDDADLPTMPIGDWVKLQFYCKRHPTDGVIKVWMNDNLIIHYDKDVYGWGTFDTGDLDDPFADWQIATAFNQLHEGWIPTQTEYIDDLSLSDELTNPVTQNLAPVIQNLTPSDNAVNVSIDADFQFDLFDPDGDGIDENTIRVANYNNNLSISGTGDRRTVQILNADLNLTTSTAYSFDISADDLTGSSLLTTSVSFTTESPVATVGTVFSSNGDQGDLGNYIQYVAEEGFYGTFEVVQVGSEKYLQVTNSDYENADVASLGAYAVYNLQEFDEFEILVDVKSNEDWTTNLNADYALVFGFQDSSNYSYINFNALPLSSRMWHIVDGERTEIIKMGVPGVGKSIVYDNDWHELKLRYKSGTIHVSWDGERLASFRFTLPRGKVGVGSFNDSSTWDNIRIKDIKTDTVYALTDINYSNVELK